MGPDEQELQALAGAQDLDAIGFVVRTAARRIAAADGATFVLREDDRCFYADEDAIAPLWKGQRFPITECVSGWAMLHQEPAVIHDITVDERVPIASYRPTFVRSMAMVPIGSPATGAIGAYWRVTSGPSPAVVEGLQRLADAVASALEKVGLDDAPWAPNFRDDRRAGLGRR